MASVKPNYFTRWTTTRRGHGRIRVEAEAIGVSLNAEKTHTVTITDERAVFAFLGFEFRWLPSTKTGRRYPCTTPRPKKVAALLRKVRDTLRTHRQHHLTGPICGDRAEQVPWEPLIARRTMTNQAAFRLPGERDPTVRILIESVEHETKFGVRRHDFENIPVPTETDADFVVEVDCPRCFRTDATPLQTGLREHQHLRRNRHIKRRQH